VAQIDIPGPAGRLEALLESPAEPRFAAVICHPHPRFGGTMHTHAVYRLARAVRTAGGTSLRFNYRGVGRSAGSYDQARGEAEDARAALDWLSAERPGLPLLAVGFSFGAWMATLAAGRDPRVTALLLAGVALRAVDLDLFRDAADVRGVAKPVAVIQAANDEFGAPEEIERELSGSSGPRRLVTVPGATHLFTEDLDALEREAEAAVGWLLGPLAAGRPSD
jgi:alpha/beta superfamily hydrolase